MPPTRRAAASRVRAAVIPVLAAVVVAGLTGCSTTDGPKGSAISSGNPAACPGKVLDVVVSIGQWGDIADRLAGDCATVTTVLASANIDPHDFEPGTAAIAAFSGADLVVLNGVGYDQWAADTVANLDPAPVVLSAAGVAGVRTGVNPHLWYDPAVVQKTAAALTARLSALSPGAAGYFAERQARWVSDLQPYLAAVASLRATASGRHYAATETVFDDMARAVGLSDVTPAGYRRAVSNASDPAPGDLVAFRAALADGSVDVLVYNTQTSGTVPEQLRSAAAAAGVPVLDVTESPPAGAGSFLSWQLAQLTRLSAALGGRP